MKLLQSLLNLHLQRTSGILNILLQQSSRNSRIRLYFHLMLEISRSEQVINMFNLLATSCDRSISMNHRLGYRDALNSNTTHELLEMSYRPHRVVLLFPGSGCSTQTHWRWLGMRLGWEWSQFSSEQCPNQLLGGLIQLIVEIGGCFSIRSLFIAPYIARHFDTSSSFSALAGAAAGLLEAS